MKNLKEKVEYTYRYLGRRQEVQWSFEKLQKYLENILINHPEPNNAKDYEILRVTTVSLGQPKVEKKVIF